MSRRLTVAALLFAVVTGPAARVEAEPRRVTGASAMLDALQQGGTVGIPTISSLVVSQSVAAIPPQALAVPAVQQAIGVATTLSTDATNQILVLHSLGVAGAREAIDPLADHNASSNVFVTAIADGADYTGNASHAVAKPFDTTLHEFAAIVRGMREAPPG